MQHSLAHSLMVDRSMVVGHVLLDHTCSSMCTSDIDMTAHTPAFLQVGQHSGNLLYAQDVSTTSSAATHRHVPYNKSDIIIQEKQTDRCMIIDVAIPSDYSIPTKATEKMSKYVDLQIDCQRMWNKRVQVIPVIIGGTGVIDKNIKKYIGKIPGHHHIYKLQRSAILGTAHILRKVLSIKPDSVIGPNIQTT